MKKEVFQAIADPTRRAILHNIVGSPMNLNGISELVDINRPAISKHIRIRRECGLIYIRKERRERFCGAQPAQLKEEVHDWGRTIPWIPGCEIECP